jgi:hypothetical protein
MTLTHGTDRLKTDRLVLRRMVPDDPPFFARVHARPEVAQYLHPGGPRAPKRRRLAALPASFSTLPSGKAMRDVIRDLGHSSAERGLAARRPTVRRAADGQMAL